MARIAHKRSTESIQSRASLEKQDNRPIRKSCGEKSATKRRLIEKGHRTMGTKTSGGGRRTASARVMAGGELAVSLAQSVSTNKLFYADVDRATGGQVVLVPKADRSVADVFDQMDSTLKGRGYNPAPIGLNVRSPRGGMRPMNPGELARIAVIQYGRGADSGRGSVEYRRGTNTARLSFDVVANRVTVEG